MPRMNGIDAALGKLGGLGDAPKRKVFVDEEADQKKKIAAPTVDLQAEGIDGCRKRVAEQEKKIKAVQNKIADTPTTKSNKQKIAELKTQVEELQREPNYRGALTIVRNQEEAERDQRRAQREREEEEALMGGGISKKKAPEAAAPAKASAKAAAKAEVIAPAVGSFEIDVEVVGVVNSAIEGSAEAQEKLRQGAGIINYASVVKEEVATMAHATMDKLGMGLKRASLRDGALRTIRALLWNPPAVLPTLPTILMLLEETNLKSEPLGKANELATLLSTAGTHSKTIPVLALPALLAHVGTAAGGKWKVKVATLGVLKTVMKRMLEPECCPLQMGVMMPQVTTALRSAIGDARKEVKKAAEELLGHIATELVEAPEIKGLAQELIGSILDSANMEKAAQALLRTANTTFMNVIDAASFALLFPIVSRAMRENSQDAKKKGVQIVGASVNLIASPEFLTPYLAELMPLLQECLMHPAADVEREAAKTFGMLAAGLPQYCTEEIMPYLLEQLCSQNTNDDVSEVDRRGAAHGLSEVLLKRPDLAKPCLYETLLPRIEQGDTKETIAGSLTVFQFWPYLGTQQFLKYVGRTLPVILEALKHESEVVTKQAKRSLEVLVEEYGATFPKLLLPPMQEAIFFETEESQDLAMQLFFLLCDKIQDAVKFGQDFTSVEILSASHRHSLLSSIYIARTDPNPAVRRSATLLWKERVQSGPKAKAEILPVLLQYLKGLKESGIKCRVAAANACLADLASGGDIEDCPLDGVEPLRFGAAAIGADGPSKDADAVLEPPPPRRMELLKERALPLLAAVSMAPPLRPFVEAAVVSCCIEARGLADAKEAAEAELKPIVPKQAESAISHLKLEGLFEKVFEGVKELEVSTAHQPRNDGDCLVRVERLMLMYGGGHTLLKDTTLELLKGHRYGVVGRNGAGKTTLMSTIAAGGVSQIPKWLKTLHVRPEVLVEASDLTATQFCRRHNPEGDTADALQDALSHVGFPEEMQHKCVQELSGGWRMKLLIASAMMRDCDLLLLDEPTNHLDKASVEWLAEYLCSLTKSTVMVISHDPGFLNRVCTDIIQYSEKRTLEYYPGNFQDFRKTQGIHSDEEAEALLLGQDLSDFQLKPKDKEEEQEEAGEEVDAEAGPVAGLTAGALDKASKISFPIPGKLQGHSASKPVIEMKNVHFAYDEEQMEYILKDVSVKVGLGSRIGIVGKNGAGKSTLLNLLCNELQPSPGPGMTTPGEVAKHRNLRLAYIAQDHMFHLEEFQKSSPYVYIQKRYQNGYDEALQERLTNPKNEEEAIWRKEQAKRWGKYGNQVRGVCGRSMRGGELFYEVEWDDLDDPKQNTHENIAKLKKLGAVGFARAYDERSAAQAAGIDQRPLSAKEITKHFEQFGLEEELVMNRNIGTFSAGQRSKLTLGAAFWTKPHLVALDEPTNYIDMETLDSLAKGLTRFKGAVLVISHSAEFVERVCEEQWHVEGGSVTKSGGKSNK